MPLKVLLRVLAVALPVSLGLLGVIQAQGLKQPPPAEARTRPPTPVRVITLTPVELLPRVSGFGTVEPARTWRAVARIEAEVAETAPGLGAGALVPEGTPLMRLDTADLRLALAEIDARLGLLDIRERTTGATLDLARADLDLARAELSRAETLLTQGVGTEAQRDTARRQALTAETRLTEIANQQALTGAERQVLAAERASAERALGFAEIRAPYDLRITEIAAETGQVVTRGQVLLTAEGTEAVEIAAQFPIGRIGPLLRIAGDGATVLDLSAELRLPAPGHDVTWPATVTRLGEAIDPRTQSTAITVRVDDPLGQAAAGHRPPLRRNMFVEVILSAPPRPMLAVPLAAVQDGRALVVTDTGKLDRRPVTLGYTQGDLAVVTGGLAPGDRLVITDPAIAMPGMTVKPVEDAAAMAALGASASGRTGAKAR